MKNRYKHERPAGFTIVELLIVIVVIAILAAITIVAYNGINERAKTAARASELTQWKKAAELYKIEHNIECPENYVFVYGNDDLGTGDFCVMKYEAKNVGGVATSQPEGTPWVSISQTAAISTASAACAGCQLLTDAQWMTLAADILSVKYNWSGGEVGSGFIYSGHNDNSPANALAASADDEDGYAGTNNSIDTGANQKRTLYLRSGDVIWDLAGNVWEWTSDTISGAQPGASGYEYRQYNSISSWGNLPAGSRPGALAGIDGLSGITGWSSSQGIGQVYSNSAETGVRVFLRGGGWGNASDAGVLTLHLAHAPSGSSTDLGFRVSR